MDMALQQHHDDMNEHVCYVDEDNVHSATQSDLSLTLHYISLMITFSFAIVLPIVISVFAFLDTHIEPPAPLLHTAVS